MPPAVCPNCGADVPRGAKACPECGSDERTGWSEEAQAGGLDLPDPEFSYDDFIKREFSHGPAPRGLHWFWWVAALAALVAFILLLV